MRKQERMTDNGEGAMSKVLVLAGEGGGFRGMLHIGMPRGLCGEVEMIDRSLKIDG